MAKEICKFRGGLRKGVCTAVFLLACSLVWEARADLTLSTMSFNIRNGRAKDGENAWEKRKEFTADVIRDYKADVVGLQEAFREQMDFLVEALPEFAEIGEGRDGGEEGEYSAILYRKDRFKVIDSGTFWLSDTPEKPSITWGNACVRVCTWARFQDGESGRTFYLYNTHLDHKSQPSREKSVRLIADRIADRKHPDPVILMGDFNAGEDNPVVTFLTNPEAKPLRMVDSFRVLHPDEAVVGTGNRFTGRRDGAKIDYVFVEPGTKVTEATIIRTSREGRYPSDHFPVGARLRLGGN